MHLIVRTSLYIRVHPLNPRVRPDLEVVNGGQRVQDQTENEGGGRDGEKGLDDQIVLFEEKGDLFQHPISVQVQREQP